MNKIYLQLREEARNIVAMLPSPKFYKEFEKERLFSRQMLYSHPLLIRIKQEINSIIEDDFGHGMSHSDLVCVDAGAIIQVEMEDKSKLPSSLANQTKNITIEQSSKVTDNILLVQIAGLLHDIKRKEKQHSIAGAKFTKTFLSTGNYPLREEEIDIICCAISEHEAFQNRDVNKKMTQKQGRKSRDNECNQKCLLISNALYDADKFRWGPDNFTHTLWDMVIFSNAPISDFMSRYPYGMQILEEIKSTFRTDTGKVYGPDFIDLGIETGNRLFKIIQQSNIIAS
ncbi:MAG: hypothetical protein HQK64_03975 [Desulfamplus sp.]|nr:hypothetical protein [Desulfamplus sp.]